MADWREVRDMSPEEKAKVKYNDPRLDSFAEEVEARYELPPGLIVAIKNAGERSNTGQVSSKGAKGVMQFIDATRKAYEHDTNDPLASIDAAGRYFKDLVGRYKGNVKAAIAEYNGGVKAAKAVQEGKEIPFEETRKYISRIKEFMTTREKVAEVKASAPQMTQGTFTPDPKIASDKSYARQMLSYIQSIYGDMSGEER